jgi:hypothetical protein
MMSIAALHYQGYETQSYGTGGGCGCGCGGGGGGGKGMKNAKTSDVLAQNPKEAQT